MKKLAASILLFWCVISITHSQTIPSGYFGINYWMPLKYINFTGPGGDAGGRNIQALADDMSAVWHRIGGNGYDNYGTGIGTDSTSNDYIRAMQRILGVNPNAKFLVQVPYESGISAANAGVLVNNVENFRNNQSPVPTVYYAIGNEWDLYSPVPTCSTIQAKIQAYAIQMKSQKTYNIKIVAPSLASYTATDVNGLRIMQELIGGSTYDITGIIPAGNGNASGRPYIDVVDFHTYAGGCYGDMTSGCSGTCPGSQSCFGSSNWSTYRTYSVEFPKGLSGYPACSFKDMISANSTICSLSPGLNGLQKLISDANTKNVSIR